MCSAMPATKQATGYGKERKKQRKSKKGKKSQVILEQPQINVKGIHISYCVCVYSLELTHSCRNQKFQFFSHDQTDIIIFID